jgi:hypothetical protein
MLARNPSAISAQGVSKVFRSAITRMFTAVIVGIVGLSGTLAHAGIIPLGTAGNYAVLYEGIGGHNLQIANVTINGNIGVGGTGVVQYNGPGTITGNVDFSAANTGQFHNNNGSNVGPAAVNYSVAAVTSALTTVNGLNSSLNVAGAGLAISGTETINESAGTLATIGGIMYRVFSVTSYSENDGNLLTINGDGSGDPVIFNFPSGNVNLKGLVTLSGLTDDQVLWNFTGSGDNINLNTNNSSFPTGAYQGVILAPNDVLSMNAANLDGRFFGGDSQDMQIVSHSDINAPVSAPEPVTVAMIGVGLVGLGAFVQKKRQS